MSWLRPSALLLFLSACAPKHAEGETGGDETGGDDTGGDDTGGDDTGGDDTGGDELGCWSRIDQIPLLQEAAYDVDGHLFLASDEGLVHWDGDTWSTIQLGQNVEALWASAIDDVWMVSGASVLHYDGQVGETVYTLPENSFLSDTIWGSSQNDIWIAGHTQEPSVPASDLYHYDGQSWSRVALEFEGTNQHLWGTSSDDVWMATSNGLLHWDGDTWIATGEHPGNGATRIWGLAADDLWLSGINPEYVVRFDGDSWQQVPTPGYVRSVWGPTPEAVLALGDDLFRWNGQAFDPMNLSPIPFSPLLWGYGDDPIVISRESVHRVIGDNLQLWVDAVQGESVNEAWVESADAALAADEQRLLGLIDRRWRLLAPPAGESAGLTLHIGARSMTDAYIAGFSSVMHYDGTTLTPVELPDSEDLNVQGIYVDDYDAVWLVGQNEGNPEEPDNDPDYASRVLRADADVFVDVSPAGVFGDLGGVGGGDGHVFTFGYEGVLLHHDGETWSHIDPGPDLIQWMYAAGATDVYIEIFDGDFRILHWDGIGWGEPEALAGFSWNSMTGSGPSDVWAFGFEGEFEDADPVGAHLVGETWEFVDLPPELGLGTAFAGSNGDLLYSTHTDTWVRACK